VALPVDLDGDGNLDVAVVGNNTGVSILRGLGNGTFAPPLHFPAPAFDITSGDFNGDGQTDLATAGYFGNQSIGILLADTAAPPVACDAPDLIWHPLNVSLNCTASDAVAGLQNLGDAAFSLSTTVASGNETANAFTGSRNVCDRANNCSMAGPIGANKVDLK